MVGGLDGNACKSGCWLFLAYYGLFPAYSVSIAAGSCPWEAIEVIGVMDRDIAAKVEVSRLLARWSDPDGFLRRSGPPPKVVYYPAERVLAGRPEK